MPLVHKWIWCFGSLEWKLGDFCSGGGFQPNSVGVCIPIIKEFPIKGWEETITSF